MPEIIIHSKLCLNGEPIEWYRSEDGRSAKVFLFGSSYLQREKILKEMNSLLNNDYQTSEFKFVGSHYKTLIIYDISTVELILNEKFQKKTFESSAEIPKAKISTSNSRQRKKQKTWINHQPPASVQPTEVSAVVYKPTVSPQLQPPLQLQQSLAQMHDHELEAAQYTQIVNAQIQQLQAQIQFECFQHQLLLNYSASFFQPYFAFDTRTQVKNTTGQDESILGKRESFTEEESPEDMLPDRPLM